MRGWSTRRCVAFPPFSLLFPPLLSRQSFTTLTFFVGPVQVKLESLYALLAAVFPLFCSPFSSDSLHKSLTEHVNSEITLRSTYYPFSFTSPLTLVPVQPSPTSPPPSAGSAQLSSSSASPRTRLTIRSRTEHRTLMRGSRRFACRRLRSSWRAGWLIRTGRSWCRIVRLRSSSSLRLDADSLLTPPQSSET